MQQRHSRTQLIQHAAQHRLLAQPPLQRGVLAIAKPAVEVGREQLQIGIIQLWVRVYRHLFVSRIACTGLRITRYALRTLYHHSLS